MGSFDSLPTYTMSHVLYVYITTGNMQYRSVTNGHRPRADMGPVHPYLGLFLAMGAPGGSGVDQHPRHGSPSGSPTRRFRLLWCLVNWDPPCGFLSCCFVLFPLPWFRFRPFRVPHVRLHSMSSSPSFTSSSGLPSPCSSFVKRSLFALALRQVAAQFPSSSSSSPHPRSGPFLRPVGFY